MKHIKREQFIWDFQNRETIPSCYKSVCFNKVVFPNENALETPEPVLYVSLMPTYLDYTLINHEHYHHKKIVHKGKDGAGLLIDGVYTIEAYLQKFTKRQLRVNVKRAITRLEASFNITYEYNFGAITEEKCLFLLSELKRMLEKRFLDKNMENMFLKDWELHTNALCEMINAKKASLVVVYSDNKPISISLNMHIKNSILFAKTNAYDTDYAKFSLGHLDNYLLLEWCLKNNYKFLDLGFGIMDYKMKWCNLFYDCEYHMYTKKRSLIAHGIALFELAKIKLKNSIKVLNLRERVKNIKSVGSNTEKIQNNTVYYSQEDITETTTLTDSDFIAIDIKKDAYASIRLPIYDYLYTNQWHIDAIKTFKINTEENSFVFIAGNNIIKLNKQDDES